MSKNKTKKGKKVKMRMPSRKELGTMLFTIHTHAEIAASQSASQIVYREGDLVALLTKLGFPKPKYGAATK